MVHPYCTPSISLSPRGGPVKSISLTASLVWKLVTSRGEETQSCLTARTQEERKPLPVVAVYLDLSLTFPSNQAFLIHQHILNGLLCAQHHQGLGQQSEMNTTPGPGLPTIQAFLWSNKISAAFLSLSPYILALRLGSYCPRGEGAGPDLFFNPICVSPTFWPSGKASHL